MITIGRSTKHDGKGRRLFRRPKHLIASTVQQAGLGGQIKAERQLRDTNQAAHDVNPGNPPQQRVIKRPTKRMAIMAQQSVS